MEYPFLSCTQPSLSLLISISPPLSKLSYSFPPPKGPFKLVPLLIPPPLDSFPLPLLDSFPLPTPWIFFCFPAAGLRAVNKNQSDLVDIRGGVRVTEIQSIDTELDTDYRARYRTKYRARYGARYRARYRTRYRARYRARYGARYRARYRAR